MALARAWRSAAPGRLPPVEQAKLLALRWVLRKNGEDDQQYVWMAQQVRVAGEDGKPAGTPSRQSVRDFFLRVDAVGEESWYPGMRSEDVGRPKELSGAAAKAMRMKAKGRLEPCYDNLKGAYPALLRNPSTGRPFSRRTVNTVLTTLCYDKDPEDPWQFLHAPRRRPLTDSQRAERAEWARRLLRENDSETWYHKHVIWVDVCSKVLAKEPRKACEAVRYGKSKKRRLMSPGCRGDSENIGGTKESQKQCSQGDTRVWYFVAMARGVYAAHAFVGKAYHAETQALAADCVSRLPSMLTKMLGNVRKPNVIFSDRGPGFYHRRYGSVTPDYDEARAAHGFQLWAGTNSKEGPHRQPPDIADVLLHETANAWLSLRLDRSAEHLQKPWEETPAEFARRLGDCVKDINRTCDVDSLCRSFPKRLRDLQQRGGDRLPH